MVVNSTALQHSISTIMKVRYIFEDIKMDVTLPLEKMSTEDKIRTMEIIWEDLCKKAESVPSPSWHKDVLAEREKAIETGKEKFIDWNEAKKQIEDKIS